jgi:poly(3-hydroxybutyrate) depolymerase
LFLLQTVRSVFVEHGDISGVGQTEAVHALCANIPAERRRHWLQPGVGHYGVFNGTHFRAERAFAR